MFRTSLVVPALIALGLSGCGGGDTAAPAAPRIHEHGGASGLTLPYIEAESGTLEAPIVVDNERVGVVSIGKPKTNIQRFIDAALSRAQTTFAKRLKDPAPIATATARLVSDLDGKGIEASGLGDAVEAELRRDLAAAYRGEPDVEEKSAVRAEYIDFSFNAPAKINPFDLAQIREEGENQLGQKILSLHSLLKVIMGARNA